jgi:hypothetical protein
VRRELNGGRTIDDSRLTIRGLVFVYNAESGLFNAVADAAHKIFSPRTYPCNLCALTHSALGMRKDWKRFLEGLGVPLEFLHADELKARYGAAGVPLPAVFTKNDAGLEVLLEADAINACRTGDELKQLIVSRIKAVNRES